MNLCKRMISDSSRQTIDNAVQHVLNEPLLFTEFLAMSYSNTPQFANRASRVVYYSSKKNDYIIKSYINLMVENLNKISIVTVKAIYYKIFSEHINLISSEEIAYIIDSAIFDLQKAIQPSMVVYACDFLLVSCKCFPELKSELIAVLESQMYSEQKSIRNKVKKTIYFLERLN